MSRRVTFLAVLFLSVWLLAPRFGTVVTLGKAAPDVAGESWINSKPLTLADLKGRVVLVEFWTYG